MLTRDRWEEFAKGFTELTGLSRETLEMIPAKARDTAAAAVQKFKELERHAQLRPGVYYIVLVDLCGSTNTLDRLGQNIGTQRIQAFVLASIQALDNVKLRGTALPLKDAGDAMLFIFTAFPDVMDWWRAAHVEFEAMSDHFLNEHAETHGMTAEEMEVFRIRARTVVHLGEVAFPDKENPIALAVSHTFKAEKQFNAGELGCTDVVRTVIEPLIREHKLKPERRGTASVSEGREMTTWILARQGK
ncbi:MAG TPA: hypothetical protein VKT78_01140 [Fimbriimonadaceae bacterium]|nr:hypothetical protein [Fimbriimonadaceae bacterium]